jgi:hypothetical protein
MATLDELRKRLDAAERDVLCYVRLWRADRREKVRGAGGYWLKKLAVAEDIRFRADEEISAEWKRQDEERAEFRRAVATMIAEGSPSRCAEVA